MKKDPKIPKIGGHTTTIKKIDGKQIVEIKPTYHPYPIMILGENGIFQEERGDNIFYYKMDSYGARWVRKEKKNSAPVDFPKYVPDNVLAVLTAKFERGEMSFFKLKQARRVAKKSKPYFLQSMPSSNRKRMVTGALKYLNID